MKKIGTGVFHWEGDKCDHGMVFLFFLSGHKGQIKIKLDPKKDGVHLQLMAKVERVLGPLSSSRHYEKFTSASPQIPKVGEEVFLCEGLLATCNDAVCYRPNEERGKTLLDIGALYTLQGHVVSLYIKED